MTRYYCSMNPLLRQSVLVLWVVTRRGCPLPKENCTSNTRTWPVPQPFVAAASPGSNLAVRCASCQVLGPVLGLVGHLCLPVELSRPTRPPRSLPRYHTTTRSASSSTTRLARTLSLRTLPTRRTESYSFRRADDTRRARVPPSIVFHIRAVAV